MARGPGGGLIRSIQGLFDDGAIAALDDEALLSRFLARDDGSHAAFEGIVARHGAMVYSVCRTVTRSDADAEDAFQAVFLILACRAAGVRRRGALGPWLFGVARRTALQARKQSARRREREAAAASLTPVAVGPRDPDDAVAALMEEVDRLPSRYRDPVVLCHLQGLTYEAAAGRLGCPLGTLSVRLKRARERLRTRLERRGVDAPAIIPPVAAVPEALAAATSRLALLVPPSLRGGVPVSVFYLTRGALRTMRMTRIVIASTAFLALAAGAWAWNASASGPSDGPAEAQPVAKYRMTGRVVEEKTGQPIAGATIHIRLDLAGEAERVVRSGDDGAYTLALPPGHVTSTWVEPPAGYYQLQESFKVAAGPFALSDGRPVEVRDFSLTPGMAWEFQLQGPGGEAAGPISGWVGNQKWLSQSSSDGNGVLKAALPESGGEARGRLALRGEAAPLRFAVRWDGRFDPSAAWDRTRLTGEAHRYWITDAGGRSAFFEDESDGRLEPRIEAGRLVIRAVFPDGPSRRLPEITGTVVDGAGNPIEGAYVMPVGSWDAKPDAGWAMPLQWGRDPIRTDAQGRFRAAATTVVVDGFPIKSVRVSVRAEGFAGAMGPRTRIGQGETLGLSPVVLERGCTLAGTVVDPAGKPVVGALIESDNGCDFLPARARSGAEGRFRLDGLREGSLVCPIVLFGTLQKDPNVNFRIRRDGEPVLIRLLEPPSAADAPQP
ncbi:MAG: hypothetical protein BGO49_12400 [Planctomycetales bacterium 71-10]|nr:MAG: hypothetical protein BGO49_12400 [Planctomycetales bacterium 71-10]